MLGPMLFTSAGSVNQSSIHNTDFVFLLVWKRRITVKVPKTGKRIEIVMIAAGVAYVRDMMIMSVLESHRQ